MKWLNRAVTLLIGLVPVFWMAQVKNERQKRWFDKLWQGAWLKEGYAQPENIQTIAEHYREFDSHSVDLLLYFLFIPIGTIRLILNSQNVSVPVLRDFQVKGDWDPEQVLEITLLSVLPKFQGRSHIASLFLMRGFYRYAKKHNLRWAVIAADRRLYVMLKRIFIVEKLGEGLVYEGSLTIPACIDLDAQEAQLPTRNPKLYQFFTKGRL